MNGSLPSWLLNTVNKHMPDVLLMIRKHLKRIEFQRDGLGDGEDLPEPALVLRQFRITGSLAFYLAAAVTGVGAFFVWQPLPLQICFASWMLAACGFWSHRTQLAPLALPAGFRDKLTKTSLLEVSNGYSEVARWLIQSVSPTPLSAATDTTG